MWRRSQGNLKVPNEQKQASSCYEQLKKMESDDEGLSNKNTELFSRVDT